tara:strand:+ start:1123 stop:1533 length:411 start_codon:yes stop_codon:yes gene_type:complete
MRLAVLNDDQTLDQVYSGDQKAVDHMKTIFKNCLDIPSDFELDLNKQWIAKDGELVEIKPSDTEKHEQVMLDVREQCRIILKDTDKWMLPDAPNYISSKLDAWKTYRQSIRDFPATIGTDIVEISQVTFPTPPSFR